jgi:hypothetical protein
MKRTVFYAAGVDKAKLDESAARLKAAEIEHEARLAAMTPAELAKWNADHAPLWARMQSEVCPLNWAAMTPEERARWEMDQATLIERILAGNSQKKSTGEL